MRPVYRSELVVSTISVFEIDYQYLIQAAALAQRRLPNIQRAMPPSKRGGKPPQHRGHRHGNSKRYMELMPSVSRSSGLEKDGDALKDFKIQEEYREFIQGKLDDYWRTVAVSKDDKRRQEVEQNLLILFRKLREGLLSSDRHDAFALEVYETSLHLSIIFRTPVQTTSTLSHLLPDLYLHAAAPSSLSTNAHPALHTTILALLHSLVSVYPSQSRYRDLLRSLPRTFLPRESVAYRWMVNLARNLTRCNYASLDMFTQQDALVHLATPEDTLSTLDDPTPGGKHMQSLYFQALCTLVDALRAKARETTWLILRSAYRELTCPSPDSGLPLTTSEWLARSLALRPVLSQTDANISIAKLLDDWLNSKTTQGEVRPKDGAEGKWIVCKVPVKA